MDYQALLAQVLALLQQEQRLSYRVLKRRLHLDDDLLEDLKEDLIYAKQLAEACGRIGQVEEGLSALEEALEALPTAEDHFYEAEVYRLNGELLLQQSTAQQGQAEEHFHQALTVARRQQAKALELRAAMSLARLWQQQGKRQEAYAILAPVYNWFTEGFDTADLQEAKALLDALA